MLISQMHHLQHLQQFHIWVLVNSLAGAAWCVDECELAMCEMLPAWHSLQLTMSIDSSQMSLHRGRFDSAMIDPWIERSGKEASCQNGGRAAG